MQLIIVIIFIWATMIKMKRMRGMLGQWVLQRQDSSRATSSRHLLSFITVPAVGPPKTVPVPNTDLLCSQKVLILLKLVIMPSQANGNPARTHGNANHQQSYCKSAQISVRMPESGRLRETLQPDGDLMVMLTSSKISQIKEEAFLIVTLWQPNGNPVN